MKSLGEKGEELAVGHLKKKGYLILKRNYRSPVGEIDIIAEDHGTVVFVEVKTRTPSSFGLPEQAVNAKKQEKIKKTALHYMSSVRKKELPARFDIVSILVAGPAGVEIEHIEGAFIA